MAFSKKRYFLLHSVTGALIATVILAFLLPFNFSKYRIQVSDITYAGGADFLYHDLDNDSIAERIDYYKNFFDHPAIVTFREDKLIVQKDFRGKNVDQDTVIFFDHDKNGLKEIFMFSRWGDSLFCNAVEPSSVTDPISTWFLDTLVTLNGETDIAIDNLGIRHLSADSAAWFIFSVNTGYAIYPRRTYALNLQTGFCLKSPVSFTVVSELDDIYDEKTSMRYFFGNTSAFGNDKKNNPPRDSLLWFKVFDVDLREAFPPMVLGAKPSNTYTRALKHQDSLCFITLVHNRGKPGQPSKLIKFTPGGKKILEKDIQSLDDGRILLHLSTIGKETRIFIISTHGEVYSFDVNFNFIEEFLIPENQEISYNYADLNGDGLYEVLRLSKSFNSLLIFSEDMKQVVEMDILYDRDAIFLSQTRSPEGRVTNYFQSGSRVYTFSYGLNPWRILSFMVLLLIFGFLILNIIYWRSYQKLRAEKKQMEIKDKMVTLQLTNLSNQFNPHFTLNILNSIASAGYQDKGLADNLVARYAKILRKNIIQVRSFEIPLKEELENIRELCELEKACQENQFECTINCEEGIEDTLIPKTLVLGFIENAIKHGIRLQPDSPRIAVNAFTRKGLIIIEVIDNGPGIKEGKPDSSSGMGFSLTRQAIDLYQQITGGIISFKFEPATDGSIESFTRVVITINKGS